MSRETKKKKKKENKAERKTESSENVGVKKKDSELKIDKFSSETIMIEIQSSFTTF